MARGVWITKTCPLQRERDGVSNSFFDASTLRWQVRVTTRYAVARPTLNRAATWLPVTTRDAAFQSLGADEPDAVPCWLSHRAAADVMRQGLLDRPPQDERTGCQGRSLRSVSLSLIRCTSSALRSKPRQAEWPV